MSGLPKTVAELEKEIDQAKAELANAVKSGDATARELANARVRISELEAELKKRGKEPAKAKEVEPEEDGDFDITGGFLDA